MIEIGIQWIPDPKSVDSVSEMNDFSLDPVDLNSGKKASEAGMDLPAVKMGNSLLTKRDSSLTITPSLTETVRLPLEGFLSLGEMERAL